MMKLVVSGPSPFARKAVVTILELGIRDRVEDLPVAASPAATIPELNAINPLGRIPALLTEDGKAIFDSPVICRYLNEQAGGKLYPAGDWDVFVLEAMADGILDSAVSMLYERRFRTEEMQSADWISWQWTKIARALDHAEAAWLERLAGPVDAGQIALGCALGYLDFRHGDRGWREGRPGLAAWEAAFVARPSMQATLPKG